MTDKTKLIVINYEDNRERVEEPGFFVLRFTKYDA